MIRNNKGFAISSMLYGILAITIIILASILSILRSNHTYSTDISYSVSEGLDKCAKRQTLMNDCYLEGNDCKIEQSNYNACIGVKDSTTTVTGTSPAQLSNTLLAAGVVKLVNIEDNNLYYFKGDNPNNYILFEGRRGRIIYFETNGTMKVIFDNQNVSPNNNIFWDDTSDKSNTASIANLWTGSKIYNYLNEEFLNGFTDLSKIRDRSWYVGNIYTGVPFYGTNGYYTREKTSSAIHKVGLPTVSDVVLASSNTSCIISETTNLAIASTGCLGNNWMLSTTGMWLLNGIASPTRSTVETGAYSISNTNIVLQSKSNVSLQVRPVVYISNANIKTGTTGSTTNPYVIN